VLVHESGETVSDEPIGIACCPLVDQRRAHVVVPHPRHEVLGRHARFGRPDVARVAQVVEVQAGEPELRHDLRPLHPLTPGPPPQRPTLHAGEHQRVLISLRVHIAATQRGLSAEEGGYLWTGELRFWDNQVFTGWYAATDGAVRSKGTMFLIMHPHGIHMTGRWVGLGYDDQIMSGWATMGKTRDESEQAMADLISARGRAL
jgi:hypothetical protein